MSREQGQAGARRLFTPLGIAIGTALGSLIAGFVMLWMNFRTLGYSRLGNQVAAAGTVVYLIIVGIASALPGNPLIGIAFVALQCVLAYWITGKLQGRAIDYHRSAGAPFYGVPMSALVGLVTGLAAVMALLLLGRAFDLPIGISPG